MRRVMTYTIFASAAAAVAGSAVAASADYYLKLGDVKPVLSKVEVGESQDDRHKNQIEILSWSWGATMAGDWDGTIKGAASAGKYGAVSGAHRDDSLNSASTPTEKRQHGWVTVSKPLDRGAVRVKVKFPWLDCKVGAAFPDAVLQNDAGRYEFEDAIITGCAPDEVSLNYAKVQVRGWDPARK